MNKIQLVLQTIFVLCLFITSVSYAAGSQRQHIGFIESLNVDNPDANIAGATQQVKMRVSGRNYRYTPAKVDVIANNNNMGSDALKTGAKIQFYTTSGNPEIIQKIILLNARDDLSNH